jgi:hypothetical protein
MQKRPFVVSVQRWPKQRRNSPATALQRRRDRRERVLAMKLLRYGTVGQERPGLLDTEGHIRDLSGYLEDIVPSSLDPDNLARLATINTESLPRVKNQARLGVPVAQIGKIAKRAGSAAAVILDLVALVRPTAEALVSTMRLTITSAQQSSPRFPRALLVALFCMGTIVAAATLSREAAAAQAELVPAQDTASLLVAGGPKVR